MEINDVIQKIESKYHEINWRYTNKNFSEGTNNRGYYIQIPPEKSQSMADARKPTFLLNGFSKTSVANNPNLKNYIVITKIKTNDVRGNIEITKGNKEKNKQEVLVDFERNVNSNQKYFHIEQDFFTSHIFKVLDNGKEVANYEDSILENLNIQFMDLQSFQDAISITEDNWDDYGYKTLLNLNIWGERFFLRVNPKSEAMIAYLKGKGKEPAVKRLCSLGGVEYYEFLKKYLTADIRDKWFSRAQDLAYNIATLNDIAEYYGEHKDDKGEELEKLGIKQPNGLPNNFFNNSFLRTTSLKEIKDIFHPLTIAGISEKDQGELSEELKTIKKSVDDSVTSIPYSFSGGKLEFVKKREASKVIPTAVYALIGGNGSGKSHTINEIIRRHMKDDHKFSSMMHFSLSPFDNIIKYDKDTKIVKPIETDDDGIKYENIGFASIKHPVAQKVLDKLRGQKLDDIAEWFEDSYNLTGGTNRKDVTMKDSFTWYIQNLLLDFIAKPEEDFKLWLKCLELFSFEQWAEDIKKAFEDKQIQLDDFKKLSELSSGQSTILLYLTKLVNNVNRGCLVIFDEPETFMHPPMIKSFIRAVSLICEEKKAFCLIATHSPIILQEIPHDCVYKLHSNHQLEKVKHKTFGENLESLYKNIYGVELQRTGFMSLLTKLRNKRIEEINNGFDSEENHTVIGDEIEAIQILSDVEEGLLGDEAFLKYLLIKDELNRYLEDIKGE